MKKLGLLLASLGAGLLLVGGTVAAYIVTSADTLGARVSPGNLDQDTTGHIRLDWGGDKVITNVSGLTIGGEAQRIAELTLTAESDLDDVTTSQLDAFRGSFKREITNLSDHSTYDLIDFLDVKTYKYNGGYDYNSPITFNDGIYEGKRGDKFETRVALKTQGGNPAVDTASVFDIISNQVVYVSFSWGPKDSDTNIQNVRTIYYLSETALDNPHFYAYKGTVVNNNFPGAVMDYVYDTHLNDKDYHVYAVEFDASKFEKYNFNNGTHQNEVKVDAPADIDDLLEAEIPAYLVGTGWIEKPSPKLATYYIRGSVGGVDYWSSNANRFAMTPNGETQYSAMNVQLYANDEIRIFEPEASEETQWHGPQNWKIIADGKYDVHYDPAKVGHDGGGWSQGMYVYYKSIEATCGSAKVDMQVNYNPTSGADLEFEGKITDAPANTTLAFTLNGQAMEFSVDSGDGNKLNGSKQFGDAGSYNIYLKKFGTSYQVYCANA